MRQGLTGTHCLNEEGTNVPSYRVQSVTSHRLGPSTRMLCFLMELSSSEAKMFFLPFELRLRMGPICTFHSHALGSIRESTLRHMTGAYTKPPQPSGSENQPEYHWSPLSLLCRPLFAQFLSHYHLQQLPTAGCQLSMSTTS
jgi:hypothetical protein